MSDESWVRQGLGAENGDDYLPMLHNTSDLFTNFRHSRHPSSGIHQLPFGWKPAFNRGEDES